MEGSGTKLPVCPKCGAAQLAAAKYCSMCGTELVAPSVAPAIQSPPKINPAAVVFIVIFAVIAIMALSTFLGNQKTPFSNESPVTAKPEITELPAVDMQPVSTPDSTAQPLPEIQPIESAEQAGDTGTPSSENAAVSPRAETAAIPDPLLETDYIYDGYDAYAYAYKEPLGAWAAYGLDGISYPEVSTEDEIAGNKLKWYLLMNYTKVEVVEESTQFSSVIGVRVNAGQEIEEKEGGVFKAEGKTTLYVWKEHVIRKGRFNTTEERLAYEESQKAEAQRIEDEANRKWEQYQR